jgi:GT2 family glycosyltransferase/glycosyltransferase involved in cell wall biosynthesis/SAM-dependent methyltransferase
MPSLLREPSPQLMSGTVTVAVPVLNGARFLDEVLTAVRAQRVDREVELLVVDSGSTDGSIEIAQRHRARIHEIPKNEFSHGGTRNLIMELSEGDHVAFLTQDATPAHDRWLPSLLAGFEQADDVAVVFGPHDARPFANHVIKAEMERHFANWGDGREIDVQHLDSSPEGLAAYRAEPWRLTFLSSVNCCLARSAWQRVPFRDVPYAEDQLLGRELIETGYAKVFHPDAHVLHSHDFGSLRFFRRYFDEWRGIREVLGHREPSGIRSGLRAVSALTDLDREWLRARGVRGLRLAWKLAQSRQHHFVRMAGAYLGSRADRLPAWLRRRFSLEGRDTFAPVDMPPSRLLVHPENVAINPDWGWEFVRRARHEEPVRADEHAPRSVGPLTIAWVIPPWRVGSGGHAAIFQLIRGLEELGHSCAVFVFDPFHYDHRPAAELREEIRERFVPLDAEVFVGPEDFDSADVAVATNWWTAYPVRDLPRCREKVYLVQDHETEFYPTSVESLWAEETYKMGFRCLAYTPWIADVLRSQYGLEVAQFDCGVDLDTYTPDGSETREPGLIAVYGRGETSRRAVELAIAGLTTLFERRIDAQVVLFGSNFPPTVPFPCENLGVVPPAELAALYRRASIGVVFSLTNLSLVDQEMMACGLPVVELDVENVSKSLGRSGEIAVLARPTPDGIAGELDRLLDSPEERSAMAERARRFVEGRTWAHAAGQVESALLGFLARPRTGLGVAQPDGGGSRAGARPLGSGKLREERGRVTEILYDRLDAVHVPELENRITADATPIGQTPTTVGTLWRQTNREVDRKRLTLLLGVHYGDPMVLERTGLLTAMPGGNIHRLGEGPLAAGGSIYHADLVADALSSCGVDFGAGMQVLDFGCSSGRVVRVLANAYPEVEWHGCDPNETAIAWAAGNLTGIEFRTSPVRPPLDYERGSFDAVYAISIWSHFAEEAALGWLDEMHRIVGPDGKLLLTTHGYSALAGTTGQEFYSGRQREIIRALESSGYWFDPIFGEQGDDGIVDRAWGMSFLTPEWMRTRASPEWRVAGFAPGRNEGDQDVFVLDRVALVSGGGVASSPEAASSAAMTTTLPSPVSRR